MDNIQSEISVHNGRLIVWFSYLLSDPKMTEPVVIVEVFERDYPLPLSAVKRSKTFSQIFSGKYAERNRTELNFDPLLQPAWDLVYDYLLTPRTGKSWASFRLLHPDLLWDLFQIGEYLQIDDLIDDFRKLIINGNIPVSDLVKYHDRYRDDSALNQAAAVAIIRGNNQFSQLPRWVQEIFSTYQTRTLPPNGFLLARVYPLNYQELYLDRSTLQNKYGPQYNQFCPERQQPQVLSEAGLVRLSPNQIIHQVDDLFLLCPSGYPRFDRTPCCQRGRPGRDTQVQIPWQEIGDRVAMMSEGGFLVFLPPEFQGDYVHTYEYEYLPEIKAVVI